MKESDAEIFELIKTTAAFHLVCTENKRGA
jgi:hypothetical protein